MRDLLTRFAPPSANCLLARLDGAPTGCVAFFDRGNATMEIKRMFVDPAARGHGIGGRMLDLLSTQGQAMGHRRALLSTHHSVHSAHALYKRAGFRKVPFSDKFAGATDGIDVCMETAVPLLSPT